MSEWIYFIQVGDDGPIKIGYSANPERRLTSLQTGHHAELRIIGMRPGGISDERELQARFAEQCLGREWFAPSEELYAEAEKGGLPDQPDSKEALLAVIHLESGLTQRAIEEAYDTELGWSPHQVRRMVGLMRQDLLTVQQVMRASKRLDLTQRDSWLDALSQVAA